MTKPSFCKRLKLFALKEYWEPTQFLDELHLKYSFTGTRMMQDQLNRAGHAVGRKHAGT